MSKKAALLVYENLNSIEEDNNYWEKYIKFHELYWDGPNASQNVSAADASVSNLTLSASADHQTEFVVAQSVIVGGDGGDISTNLNGGSFDSEPLTGPVSNIVVSNTPGQLRFTTTHAGQPNETRNNATSTVDLIVTYNAAIDDVATFDNGNWKESQLTNIENAAVLQVRMDEKTKQPMVGFSPYSPFGELKDVKIATDKIVMSYKPKRDIELLIISSH